MMRCVPSTRHSIWILKGRISLRTPMDFISTRGQAEPCRFQEVVARGLAPDRGLYLPRDLPDLSGKLETWSRYSYPELCTAFLTIFADDLDPVILQRLISEAYQAFDGEDVAPLVQLEDSLYVLELFSGPTLAFKDYALQVLGKLYGEQIKHTGEPLNVLGATSGDTGAAAISGLAGIDGVHTFILYPRGRVSPLQERQMTCTGSATVFPLAIEGSFDDAQRELKAMFGDPETKASLSLSAVNSINLARILAQCVYYLHAFFRVPPEKRALLEVVVPTGNFGNLLAGWLLTRMGFPIPCFRVATNRNDILYRLFQDGRYEKGEVQPSLAPSMDIQAASNFERFLYYFVGEDPEAVRMIMDKIQNHGSYQFEDFKLDSFRASRTEDGEILHLIQDVYRRYGYVCDPHTATGFKDLAKERVSLVLATAHPAKFPDTIEQAIGQHPTHPRLEALKERNPVSYSVKPTAEAIRSFIEENRASL